MNANRKSITLAAAALTGLVLAGCSTSTGTDEFGAVEDTGSPAESQAGGSASDTSETDQQTADEGTGDEAASNGELNCASILPNDELLAMAGPDLGLTEQVAVTDRAYEISLPDTSVTITADRGLSCEILDSASDTITTFEYVEFSPEDGESIDNVGQTLSEPTTTEAGAELFHREFEAPDASSQSLIKGDGWLLIITGDLSADDATLQDFNAQLREEDANDHVANTTASCSMFFEPLESGQEPAFGVERSGFDGLYQLDQPLATGAAEGDYTHACDGIEWQPGEPTEDAVPDGEPIASNERCEVYEVASQGSDAESEYVSVCDTGTATISGVVSSEVASQVLPPEFRGIA
ncbi:MAG: hypothetical protein ACTHXA_10000 [Gulosibacter sp.]|uniref:hypothetical protein n=1 Tax=Gulosibacter sp. TaxID=2817531 RepID=UPI003F91A6CC